MDMKRHLKSALKQLGLDKPRKAQIIPMNTLDAGTGRNRHCCHGFWQTGASMKPLGLLIPTSLRLLSSLCLR